MLPDETPDTPPDETAAVAEPEPAAPQTTDDLLRQIIEEQANARRENVELRAELAKARSTPPPAPSSAVLSPDVLAANRQAELQEHKFYCPGCGRLYNRERGCSGSGEAPHPEIEVVPVDEILGENAGDATLHTAAPGVRP